MSMEPIFFCTASYDCSYCWSAICSGVFFLLLLFSCMYIAGNTFLIHNFLLYPALFDMNRLILNQQGTRQVDIEAERNTVQYRTIQSPTDHAHLGPTAQRQAE
ncbi:hypothetical protein BU24DRAFT_6840 [Aaosphaeria arxii CBS 175.79]|uniref:Uncharacterized protein n=1 Tax=Aaosphaeria arxii CBS 175.79 TaxID=1450172 RepID=A0A6A5Y5Y8_9PLEO|nr:uncharacterized protein BU24DRAFT_6840 [Aaosphaeria arxii CBS 175.79]KAF2020696.1 hypothetical protein BU24DRAFT_6840 [Aaosphaeria arxii CBS 175.79]